MLQTYTLEDEFQEDGRASQSRGSHSPAQNFHGHKITDIREAVRSDRLNIYINDKFYCSLDISQVVDLGVKIGKELNEEDMAELKRASEFGKLYTRALEYSLSRPHSEKELRDYLHKKTLDKKVRVKNRKTGEYQTKVKEGYDASLVPLVMNRLVERGYINDRRFAELWVENRNAIKGMSMKKLRIELLQKGISDAVIEEVLDSTERNDREELRKVIAKRQRRYSDPQKFTQYLLRQGFKYGDICDELKQEYDDWG